jgi:hypothetical protein
MHEVIYLTDEVVFLMRAVVYLKGQVVYLTREADHLREEQASYFEKDATSQRQHVVFLEALSIACVEATFQRSALRCCCSQMPC